MNKLEEWFPFSSSNNYGKMGKVICFYYAGGSSLVYKSWAKADCPFEFIPVELPGRGTRILETCIENFDKLIDELLPNLLKIIDEKPFYFYGHSMGAAIAFEVSYKLQRLHGRKPEKLIVAGRHAPHKKDPSKYRSHMGDKALIQELVRLNGTPKEVLENKELLNFILPIIKSDYKISESYSYHGEKINVPVIAHAGADDKEASVEVMKYWGEVTDGSFQIKEFPGDHFFVQSLGEKYLLELVDSIMSTYYEKII
ncbi:MAG: thioesterase [Clostridium beijerinckii]|nr:thioesterase [Clostridium beijerinckii]